MPCLPCSDIRGDSRIGAAVSEIENGIRKTGRGVLLALSIYSLLLVPGCRKAAAPVEPSHSYTQIDPATAGTIEGTVRFPQAAPPRVEIDMGQDPGCAAAGQGPNSSEQYVVNDGKLANVFVYIKDGLGNRVYAPPGTAVVLDQKGCRYVPHVIGVMAGQPVEFRTSDPTMHDVNVQPLIAGNSGFDLSQAPHGAPERRAFHEAETMIPVRCNNHPWMQAFINVASNPFFSVSDAQGHYSIHGVPPGTYTLVAVHEKLGVKQQTVIVEPHQTVQAVFTF